MSIKSIKKYFYKVKLQNIKNTKIISSQWFVSFHVIKFFYKSRISWAEDKLLINCIASSYEKMSII